MRDRPLVHTATGPLKDAGRTYRVSQVGAMKVFTQTFALGSLTTVPVQVLWRNPDRVMIKFMRGGGGVIRYAETAQALLAGNGMTFAAFPPAADLVYTGDLWVHCPLIAGEIGITEWTMVRNNA